jgi:exopolyphosphatase / guanosine-5'-triphosphate,3'-diphosphate pyrophosphatase
MRLVATEACRRARNAREFIRKIQRETGLRLEIIPPEEEARLAVI